MGRLPYRKGVQPKGGARPCRWREPHGPWWESLRAASPTFLAPGTTFAEDKFSKDWGREDGFGMIPEHYIQAHLLLCGLVPNRPGLVPFDSSWSTLTVSDLNEAGQSLRAEQSSKPWL